MTSTHCRKSKDETVTFHAHRFLWSDRLASANKIKVSVVKTTSDAGRLNIRSQDIKANARGFRCFDNDGLEFLQRPVCFTILSLHIYVIFRQLFQC